MKSKLVPILILFSLFSVALDSHAIEVYGYSENNVNEISQIYLSEKPIIIIYNPYEEINFEDIYHYKANLHTHTTESDGSSSPSDVIYHYSTIGNYDILAITDHNKNTWPWSQWISESPVEQSDSSEYYPELNMLAIAGNELSLGHHRGSLLNTYSHGGFFLRLTFLYIDYIDGLSLFFHPGRYNYDDQWYLKFFDSYGDCIAGIEVYNQGDRYSNDRLLWDRLNKNRDPEKLIWGFSNDDMHHMESHSFRNYQHFLMNNLSEKDFRNAMMKGAFYFSYEPNGSNSQSIDYGKSKTPKLINLRVNEEIIEIVSGTADTIQWYDENSDLICEGNTINISITDSKFVRAVLINQYGTTLTQPFGIQRS